MTGCRTKLWRDPQFQSSDRLKCKSRSPDHERSGWAHNMCEEVVQDNCHLLVVSVDLHSVFWKWSTFAVEKDQEQKKMMKKTFCVFRVSWRETWRERWNDPFSNEIQSWACATHVVWVLCAKLCRKNCEELYSFKIWRVRGVPVYSLWSLRVAGLAQVAWGSSFLSLRGIGGSHAHPTAHAHTKARRVHAPARTDTRGHVNECMNDWNWNWIWNWNWG